MGVQVVFSLAEARGKGLEIVRELVYEDEFDEMDRPTGRHTEVWQGWVEYGVGCQYLDYAAHTDDQVCTDAKNPIVRETLRRLGIAYEEQ